MISESSVAHEVDALLYAWRSRVLNIIVILLSASMPIPLLAILAGHIIVLPTSLRLVCLLMYAALLLAALRPSWSLYVRAGLLFVPIATVGAMQLTVSQLAGSGRISFLLLPLLALVLAGSKAGWAAAALSTSLFALIPVLIHLGALPVERVVAGTDTPPLYWALQMFMWQGALLPLMILFTRFQFLQRRTMIDERLALRRLEVEVADRQRLEAEVARIGEDERRRLGAELHDGLCQHLVAMLLNCSVLENQQKRMGQLGAEDLGRICKSVEAAIGMAYDVAKGLCPVDIEPDALVPALEKLCRNAQGRNGVACQLNARPDFSVRDPEQALHLFRIAGEAVTNAIKHARCKQVVLELGREGAEIVMSIADDGRPDSPSAPAPEASGLGQRIMAYRAGLIGGELRVERLEGGTRVTCRVPEQKRA